MTQPKIHLIAVLRPESRNFHRNKSPSLWFRAVSRAILAKDLSPFLPAPPATFSRSAFEAARKWLTKVSSASLPSWIDDDFLLSSPW